MPWSIVHKGDEWCVIKDSDGSSAGCHASRSRAVAQQRALYAQESMSAAGNGAPPKIEFAAPQRVEITTAEAAVTESMLASMQAMTETLEYVAGVLAKVVEAQNADREALTSALTAAANQPDPVVNVHVPEIVVPTPTVNVHVPKSKILIPASPTPIVNVTMPGSKKTVKFTRNLQGEVEGADIQEELDGG